MTPTPKWFVPTAVLALLWNLMGCMAYLADVRIGPDELAAMTDAQRALYASRTAWMVAATAVAVWGGAAGCLGLVLRRRWATPLLVASLCGVVVQDIGIFVLSGAGAAAGAAAVVLQGLVLLVAVLLVLLARNAAAKGWLRGAA